MRVWASAYSTERSTAVANSSRLMSLRLRRALIGKLPGKRPCLGIATGGTGAARRLEAQIPVNKERAASEGRAVGYHTLRARPTARESPGDPSPPLPRRRRNSLVHLGGQLDVPLRGIQGLAQGLQTPQVLLLAGDQLQEDVRHRLGDVADHLGIEDVVLVALLGDGRRQVGLFPSYLARRVEKREGQLVLGGGEIEPGARQLGQAIALGLGGVGAEASGARGLGGEAGLQVLLKAWNPGHVDLLSLRAKIPAAGQVSGCRG